MNGASHTPPHVTLLPRGIVARSDPAEQFLGQAPCPVRSDPSGTADDDALVGGFAPALSGLRGNTGPATSFGCTSLRLA